MKDLKAMQNGRKVVVIGLDGATFDLIKPWVNDGKLPNLANLIKNGVWGNLRSVIPSTSAPAWVSFMTGKNPGKHGIFDFVVHSDTGDSKSHLISSLSFKDKTLWAILSLHGKRVGVVNVPITYPPKAVNGFLISCFMTPPSAKVFTYPEELRQELPDYRIDTKYARQLFGMKSEDKSHLLKEQYDITEKRASAVLRLIDKWETDFFIVVFKGTDNMQHYFWDRKEILLQYYQRLDELIAGILDKSGENTNVFIISDHGFGPAATTTFFINAWLEQLGLLKRQATPKSRLFEKVYRIASRINEKINFSRLLPSRSISMVTATLNQQVAWTQTKAYSQTLFGININLKERDSFGIVEPGEEYEKIREEIVKELKILTDPETNERIMTGVFKNDEIYWGANLSKAPDIICVPNPKYSIKNTMLFAGNIFGNSPTELPGDHRAQPDGILIAYGPDIKQGEKIEEAQLFDVTPTVLHMMGIPVPKDMDGKVLKEIFRGSSEIAKRDIIYEATDEMTKVREKVGKLKNLGKL